MQIVIEIPKEKELIDKALWNDVSDFDKEDLVIVLNAIAHGIPLPKGHGRLGDLDKIKKEMQYYHDDCAKTSEYTRLGFETAMIVVEDAPTIIEADTEESNTDNKSDDELYADAIDAFKIYATGRK